MPAMQSLSCLGTGLRRVRSAIPRCMPFLQAWPGAPVIRD
jgi:hypothetical protein